MFCAECGSESMKRTNKPFIQQFKGIDFEIDEIDHWECDKCGAIEFDCHDLDALTHVLQMAYRREHRLLTPEEIKALRMKLDMSQQEFETLLGVTSPTVSRWETGRVIQTKSIDNFMRLIASSNCSAETAKEIAGLSHSGRIDIAFALDTCILYEGEDSAREDEDKERAIAYV